MKDSERYCLNCGTTLTDDYCPHCGQKSSVGRLTIKTALIDNFWSVLRMDSRVLPTAVLLATKPWVVIRDYIFGHRVRYTQPVRFIVIMCFVNIFVQLLLPDQEMADTLANPNLEESLGLHVLRSVQDFLKDSKVAIDMIDSVIFAPIVYVLFLHWGSRRYNLAEYSTAYLYLCGAGLVMDVVTLPVLLWSEDVSDLIQIVWWIILLNGLIKHAFQFNNAFVRIIMLIVNIVVICSVGILNHKLLFGIDTI